MHNTPPRGVYSGGGGKDMFSALSFQFNFIGSLWMYLTERMIDTCLYLLRFIYMMGKADSGAIWQTICLTLGNLQILASTVMQVCLVSFFGRSRTVLGNPRILRPTLHQAKLQVALNQGEMRILRCQVSHQRYHGVLNKARLQPCEVSTIELTLLVIFTTRMSL